MKGGTVFHKAKSRQQAGADRSTQDRVAVCALVVAFLAGTTPRSGATQRPSSVDSIVHLYKDEMSRAELPLRTVVGDSASFAQLWDRIVTMRAGPSPAADFGRHMVIAVTMGAQPSTGNDIAIVAVDSSARILQVQVDLTVRECLAGGMITHPADIVRVPKSRLTVTFRERYGVVRCPE